MSARIERTVDNLQGADPQTVAKAFRELGSEAKVVGTKVEGHFGGSYGAITIDTANGDAVLDDVWEYKLPDVTAHAVLAGFQTQLESTMDPFEVVKTDEEITLYVYARG